MKSISFGLLILLMSISVSAMSDDVPAWVQQTSAIHYPTYDKDVPAVVLLNELVKVVDAKG